MKALPENIQAEFYKVRYGDLSVAEFEKWVYENADELEKYLEPNDYLDLISLNFKQVHSKHELMNLVDRTAAKPYGKDFGRYVVTQLLERLIAYEDDPIPLFKTLYDFYCHGFDFLGIGSLYYGYDLDELPSMKAKHLWSEKESEQYRRRVDEAVGNAKPLAEKIIAAIDSGKIRINGFYNYEIDKETEEELRRVNYDWPASSLFAKPVKRWWKFWK